MAITTVISRKHLRFYEVPNLIHLNVILSFDKSSHLSAFPSFKSIDIIIFYLLLKCDARIRTCKSRKLAAGHQDPN